MSFKRILCTFGIHYSGTTDGGCMGDALRCDICGRDEYPEYFFGIILNRRSLSDPKPDWLTNDERKELV